MFEKISDKAEKLATNLSMSRRGFFGRVGKAALGVAGLVGGLLAWPGEALGAGEGGTFCVYWCPNYGETFIRVSSCQSRGCCYRGRCRPSYNGCSFWYCTVIQSRL